VSGSGVVLGFFTGWAPQVVVDTIASFSFISHFTSVMRGVIDLKDMVYFISLIVFFLFANTAIVELKKAD
jgi:ABC-2 type transport system permease protein